MRARPLVEYMFKYLHVGTARGRTTTDQCQQSCKDQNFLTHRFLPLFRSAYLYIRRGLRASSRWASTTAAKPPVVKRTSGYPTPITAAIGDGWGISGTTTASVTAGSLGDP